MLELYSKIDYFIGSNTDYTKSFNRRIGRKIVKRKNTFREIYRGGGQFFIKIFYYINKPNYIGEN